MITKVEKILPDPLNEIISLENAKKQLRLEVDFSDEDDLIHGYIGAAVEASENYINGDIYAKNMVIKLDGFQPYIVFEAYPVRSIESVKYWQDDTELVMPETDYDTISQNLKHTKLVFKKQPNTDDRVDAVTVTIAIGYEEQTKVPNPIKQAILLQVSDMYERREDRQGTVSTSAQALMRSYRKYT